MRDTMIFYRSFYEAIKELPKEEQANIYDAIFSYGLDFKEPQLSGISKTVWTLIKPQIDANIKRFQNGLQPKEKQEKSKAKAKRKQKISETEANNNNNNNNNNNFNNNNNDECKLEDIHPLQQYVKDKFPTVSKMDIQLTYDNCVKLLEKYPNKQVSDTLIAMENYKPLLSKSKNVYLTLLTWLRKDEKQEPKIVMPYEKRNQQ
jgi:hypothetical protein